MKTRFNTYDIVCAVSELQKLIGMRINNIYDIDNKTYLIRFQRTDEKQVLLLESGIRIHVTNFEWPKNVAPCGFTMKLRKHLKNKRIESLTQLGTDRIIDMQFGTSDAAHHLILELYDKGNIVLTDHEMTILYVLRPHTEGDKVRFAVREKYPQNRARLVEEMNKERIVEIMEKAKAGDQLKKVLIANSDYGPGLIQHVLCKRGISNSAKIGSTFNYKNELDNIVEAMSEAYTIFKKAQNEKPRGYIIQQREEHPSTDVNMEKNENVFYSNQEFHPMLFAQHSSSPYKEFESFCVAVDEFFSSLESQKLELKAVHQEREALKKLENVKKDHGQRLKALEESQKVDEQKAELITRNQELVDKVILSVQMLLAKQLSWEDIDEIVQEAQSKGDPIAKGICKLKLEINHISLSLADPYDNGLPDEEDNELIPTMVVDIDLALSAFANARRYYGQKKTAAKKQQRTLESQNKAFKSAEKTTKQTLKEVKTIASIHKARKVYWFEKFLWFISSENYLIIAGRDFQQNELIVKRYMKPKDVYVHADVHGASSIVIKNPSGELVPPKTLTEAGTMAVCHSLAWDMKVLTNAYWVWGEQVSKIAPTGEYLTPGSFMIRGKKNFLPPSHLILGLSFLFRLEDGFVERHLGERKVVTQDSGESDQEAEGDEDVEVEILDESDEDETKKEPEISNLDEKLANIPENTDTNPKNFDTDNNGKNTEEIVEQNQKEIEENNKSKNSKQIERNLDGTSDVEEESKFPDTHIKIQHFGGTKRILTEPVVNQNLNKDCQDNIIYLGDDKPVVLKPSKQKSRSREISESSNKEKTNKPDNKDQLSNRQQVKRGQKSKLKKIKEKYKDQDDEERKLRMEILQSSGTQKETTKQTKKSNKVMKVSQTKNIKKEPKAPVAPQVPREPNEIDEDEVQVDLDMIDYLTGVPLEDDELLFAVPVIAPYNTLANYKFKVKLTPGPAKRGKAVKTAVSIFLHDRSITAREKDLLKAVKDEQIARNIPGKVKVSAPNLQVLKKFTNRH